MRAEIGYTLERIEAEKAKSRQIQSRFNSATDKEAVTGLRATEDTIAGAAGLRLDLNIDNSLFQWRSPVIGMIFVNENYLKSFRDMEIYFILADECAHILKNHVLIKAFWTLLETLANGPKNENRAVVESIKLALALGSRDYLPPNASSLRNNEYEADAIGVSITRDLRSAFSCLRRSGE